MGKQKVKGSKEGGKPFSKYAQKQRERQEGVRPPFKFVDRQARPVVQAPDVTSTSQGERITNRLILTVAELKPTEYWSIHLRGNGGELVRMSPKARDNWYRKHNSLPAVGDKLECNIQRRPFDGFWAVIQVLRKV